MATAEDRYEEFRRRVPGGEITMPGWDQLTDADRKLWEADEEGPEDDSGAEENPT